MWTRNPLFFPKCAQPAPIAQTPIACITLNQKDEHNDCASLDPPLKSHVSLPFITLITLITLHQGRARVLPVPALGARRPADIPPGAALSSASPPVVVPRRGPPTEGRWRRRRRRRRRRPGMQSQRSGGRRERVWRILQRPPRRRPVSGTSGCLRPRGQCRERPPGQ